MNVEYRELPGFPGYRVGDDGTFWSCRDFKGEASGDWRQLKPWNDRKGYLYVSPRRNGCTHRFLLHRLVLEAFVGPCPTGYEACHFPDRNKANCRLDNLRWDSRSANHEDKRFHQTLPIGERCSASRLTELVVREIRRLASEGVDREEIAARYSTSYSNVGMIVTRQTWRHVA